MRVMSLMEVYFECEKEVVTFCENLFRYNKQIEFNWKIHEEWGNQLQFIEQAINHDTVQSMAKAMADVFIEHRLANWLKTIIKEKYYYTDEDEIDRILELTYWIYQEADLHTPYFKNIPSPSKLLQHLFMKNTDQVTTIHFDSIVQFRLQSFKNILIEFVGLAIDEFKQEEDHQAFVDMLRKYIAKKESNHKEIHVLQGKDFTFFNENGKKFSNIELRRMIHEEPLYIVGLDVEELNLAPLIAIAPKKITIYGDNPSEPKTLTVINVFQERVVFEPSHRFPFPHALGRNNS